MPNPIFINGFQKGSSENANIGFGSFVGIETYSKKGVAQLTKDTSAGSGTFTGLVKYIVNDNTGQTLYGMGINGSNTQFYVSTTLGVSGWSQTGSISSFLPFGMIYFKNYLLAFVNSNGGLGNGAIYYSSDGGSTWTSWKTGLNFGSPNNNGTAEAAPFIFPNDGFVYFGNGNQVGKIATGTMDPFDPTSSTHYYYNAAELSLPDFYSVNCFSFLPSNYISIGTGSLSNSQVADVILWNPTLSTYETPLRLYSRAEYSSSYNDGGVRQIINKNNILYAITGGNHCVYQTNGVTFSLIDDMSLHSNIRTTGGTENNMTVFTKAYPMAIAIQGNKLLTGSSTPSSLGYPANYGLFPSGVWTLATSDNASSGIEYGIGSVSTQLEYTISTNTIVATSTFEIGCIYITGNNSAVISWRDDAHNPAFGIDYIEVNNFQNNSSVVLIESEMIEVGTPLSPVTLGNLQFNLVRNLMTGQTISLYYRTTFDQDFQLVTAYQFTGTFTGDGTTNAYSVNSHQIGPTRYIQFQIHMATVPSGTSATIATYTPQLKDFIIGSPDTK